MLVYLLLVLLGLLLLHLYVHRVSERGRVANRIPGPPIHPVIGNALQVLLPAEELYKLMRQWSNTYYPIFRIWLVNMPLVHLRHPDDLEIVFTNKNYINKEFAYEHMYPWLKTGLLTSSGDKWQHRRKVLTPAFHFNILKKHMEMVLEQAEKTVSKLKNKGPKIIVDVMPFCMKYTLNVICESSMGVNMDGESDDKAIENYKEALDDMLNMIIYRYIRPYIKDWALPLIPNINKKIKNSIVNTDSFIHEIIQKRRQYHKDTNYENLEQLQNVTKDLDDMYLDGKKKRLAMLDLLLAAERDSTIDHDGIKEEVATFIFAGHDTTGMALTFAIAALAEYKDIQCHARKEVEEILDRKGGKLDLSDLKQMIYLERCIKETIRLFPPVPSITREVTEDLELKNYTAPKGSNIVMHIVDVHRDSNFWPNPDKFDPDRFLPEKVQKRHPFAYVPFSAGSRNCIGQKFAMMELKTFLAMILYNFQLEPIDHLCDIEIVADLITRPGCKIQTKFVKIDR